jgi:murein DD-endopeptidase MepM/ murein hydrolase activator NlpD
LGFEGTAFMKPPVSRSLVAALFASLLVGVPACAASPASTEPKSPTASLATVDQVESELIRRINAKDGKGIVALYGASMLKTFPEEKTGPFFAGILDDVGRIRSSERLPGPDGAHVGLYRLTAERAVLTLELHVGSDGKVTGLKIRPASNQGSEPPVARSSIPLALPFRGQWSVFWGGDRPDDNPHVAYQGQRRAADLDVLGPDGAMYRGDGKRNEDYYAYGQDVLAVADGTVITAIDGVPDNTPGSMNPLSALGNVVIIQHTDSLYSAYAHLQPGTLRIKVGEKIKQGVVLGHCGNSGNSSQPHLHLQLQDGPLIEKSWGVEPVFKDVRLVRKGKSATVAEYTFLKGDLIGEPPNSQR